VEPLDAHPFRLLYVKVATNRLAYIDTHLNIERTCLIRSLNILLALDMMSVKTFQSQLQSLETAYRSTCLEQSWMHEETCWIRLWRKRDPSWASENMARKLSTEETFHDDRLWLNLIAP